MKVLPAILARGYGVSFADIEKIETDVGFAFKFPSELKRGELCLMLSESNRILIPGIKIGNEVTVCIAFYVYLPETGWKMMDLRCLPNNIMDLHDETFEIKTREPNRDMSKYEPVEAFEFYGLEC